MKNKLIGTILAVAGFIGFFAEGDTLAVQLLVTGGAIAVFAAGVALLGGFKEQPINTIQDERN